MGSLPPATTCRRHRSSAFPVPSRCTATTASYIRSASSSPGSFALLLVAELLRNTGRFTTADVLSFRLKQRPVRMASALATLVVSLFYLLAQMTGAGRLVALLLDIDGNIGQGVVAIVGVLIEQRDDRGP